MAVKSDSNGMARMVIKNTIKLSFKGEDLQGLDEFLQAYFAKIKTPIENAPFMIRSLIIKGANLHMLTTIINKCKQGRTVCNLFNAIADNGIKQETVEILRDDSVLDFVISRKNDEYRVRVIKKINLALSKNGWFDKETLFALIRKIGIENTYEILKAKQAVKRQFPSFHELISYALKSQLEVPKIQKIIVHILKNDSSGDIMEHLKIRGMTSEFFDIHFVKGRQNNGSNKTPKRQHNI